VTWRVEFRPAARGELLALDRSAQVRILRSLARLADDPRNAANMKAMNGGDHYRLRVGDWRVIYALHDDVAMVLVVRVAHRREAYRWSAKRSHCPGDITVAERLIRKLPCPRHERTSRSSGNICLDGGAVTGWRASTELRSMFRIHFPINDAGIAPAPSIIVVFGMLTAFALVWWLHPYLDRHEGTAAWVQAIGAIIIIGATAWIASKASRETRDRERRVEHQLRQSIATLARKCMDALDDLLKEHPARVQNDARGSFLRAYEPSDFEIPMDAMAAIPLYQVGDAPLIIAIVSLRGAMGRIKRRLDEVARDPVMSTALEDVRNQRTSVFNAYACVLRIIEGCEVDEELSRVATRSAW
jgi:mRNA interferase RelE/StbE